MNVEKLNKIHVSADIDRKLQTLKGRTALLPNVLCRLGLVLSLREPGIPDSSFSITDGKEFNRYTLMGEYDLLIVSLVTERCVQDKLNPEENLAVQIRAHINRGVYLLYNRVKTISDLADFIP